jgi:hypothetical protein
MHSKPLSVKENVAASAQNLVMGSFPFLHRWQMSTPVAPSAGIQKYSDSLTCHHAP